MKRILVATDFSTRSDRALRRATLLARQLSGELVLVHVLDDDQPLQLVKAALRHSEDLLNNLAATARDIDRVRCEPRLLLGEPFQAIAEFAEDTDADVVIMGPHRRQALKDVFIGTTIERTIRQIRRPVMMANGPPAGLHERVLIATDLSDCSAAAVREARKLGFLDRPEVLVLHAVDAPAENMMLRSSMTMDELKDYMAQEEERAAEDLSSFLQQVDLHPTRQFVQLIELSVPETIREQVRRHKADLVIVGTHGRKGSARFFLGSVAEQVLRDAEVDVLVVPAASSTPSSQP